MNLEEFFKTYPKTALGFSGGVDSAYLLYAACQYGADVKAYYVKSQFQPAFELEDAKRIAEYCHAKMEVLKVNVLEDDNVSSNPSNRCYYCKQRIFSTISSCALRDGYTVLIDGTNASDDVNDRPGMKALQELQVLSPLRMCGITKREVRLLSRSAGLFTWNKPAYACLATRVRSGQVITEEKLNKIEKAEDYIASLGVSDFRVRLDENRAVLQVRCDDLGIVMENREKILNELKGMFDSVVLDLEVRHGSL